jgi:hypothetical protein
LSLAGKIPISDKIEKIRLEEGVLKIATQRAKTVKIKFNKLRVFSPELIEGLSQVKVKKVKNLVHDWFKIRAKSCNFDLVCLNNDFIKKILFLNKKILVISNLSDQDLLDFDYSIVPMKYSLLKILDQSGIKKKNYERKIILEHIARKIYNLDTIKVKSKKNIIIDDRVEREICQEALKTRLSLLDVYPWRLNHLLLDSNGMIR